MKLLPSILLTFAAVLILQTALYASEWKIDKTNSSVRFRVKHLLTDVWGRFNDFEAIVVYDPASPAASKVKVIVDTASIDTGHEKRDAHLRSSDFFDVEKYPHLIFESKQVRRIGPNRHEIIGDLTIREARHEIVLAVKGPNDPIEIVNGQTLTAHASATINRTHWGLTWNRIIEAEGLMVGEEVEIVIDVELERVLTDAATEE